MKSLFVLSAFLSATWAVASPKVGSVAKYKVTYSAVAEGAASEAATMTATITKIDPAQNLIVVQTAVTVNGQTETVDSEENLNLFNATLGLTTHCTLAEAKRVMSLDPTAEKVLAAELVEIDSIYGKIKTCKLTQVGDDLVPGSIWVSDKSFGFIKMAIETSPRTEVELIEYKE